MKTAVVTGSASGIGRATAERLTADGWRVIGIDLSDGQDAADPEVLAAALSSAGDELHGLVCAAGIPPAGPWDDLDAWNETLRVDLTAPYLALRVCLPALARAKGSAVVVGSIVGSVEGSSRSPAYAAAKSGLVGLATVRPDRRPTARARESRRTGPHRHTLRPAPLAGRRSAPTYPFVAWAPPTRWPRRSTTCSAPVRRS